MYRLPLTAQTRVVAVRSSHIHTKKFVPSLLEGGHGDRDDPIFLRFLSCTARRTAG